MQSNTIWGIDLGGTKIECAVLDTQDLTQPIIRQRIPTEAERGYAHMLNQIQALVEHVKQETGLAPTSIGMGIPGTLDRTTNKVKNANTTALIGKYFGEDLTEKLGVPVTLSNDANCFALAEANLGAVRDLAIEPESVFGVILGTGVGAGLVVNNRVINGLHGIGGEWGHNELVPAGKRCYCGKKGCVETVISGPALERFYQSLTGQRHDLKTITERALKGQDQVAVQTLDRLIFYFGKAIATVINIIDPDVIILGGGVGNIDLLYDRAPEAALPHVFNDQLDTLFLRPKLGDSAGVFGAALLTR